MLKAQRNRAERGEARKLLYVIGTSLVEEPLSDVEESRRGYLWVALKLSFEPRDIDAAKRE
jgi:hypothetical protein